jgi:hypothetical protein
VITSDAINFNETTDDNDNEKRNTVIFIVLRMESVCKMYSAATLSAFGELRRNQYDEVKIASKLMDYVRREDARNVRRILDRHRLQAASLCVRSVKTAGGWSALTSAADYGFTEIVRL